MNPLRINEIPTQNEAEAAAIERWRAGHDRGAGFAPTDVEMANDRRILASNTVNVYLQPDGSEIAVADANGPWAVIIAPRWGWDR